MMLYCIRFETNSRIATFDACPLDSEGPDMEVDIYRYHHCIMLICNRQQHDTMTHRDAMLGSPPLPLPHL